MGKTVLPQHKRVNIHRASFSVQILKISEGDGSVNGKVCQKSSVPTVNMANAIFEQILLISDNDIKNAYFYIRVILNTVKKKCLNKYLLDFYIEIIALLIYSRILIKITSTCLI